MSVHPLRTCCVLVLLVAAVAVATPVRAVEVSPDLRAYLDDDPNPGMIPILMVFDDPDTVGGLPLPDLKEADPQKRRDRVIAALKKKSRRAQRTASAILEGRGAHGVVAVHELYVANALTFLAKPAVVEELAHLPIGATLYFDMPFADGDEAEPLDTKRGGDGADATALDIGRLLQRDHGSSRGPVIGHVGPGLVPGGDPSVRLWTNPGEIAGNAIDDDANGFVDDLHGWDFGVEHGGDDKVAPTGAVPGRPTAELAALLAVAVPDAELMMLDTEWDDDAGSSLATMWAAIQYALENGADAVAATVCAPADLCPRLQQAVTHHDSNLALTGVATIPVPAPQGVFNRAFLAGRTPAAEAAAPRLRPNVPNPFNPSTEVRFVLTRAGSVEVGVYDLAGRLVRTLLAESLPAGERSLTWDGRDTAGRALPSGVYFARVRTADGVATGRMTLLK